VALLQAHEKYVYAPLKGLLVKHVASAMPAAVSPNMVTAVGVLMLLPFIAAVAHGYFLVRPNPKL